MKKTLIGSFNKAREPVLRRMKDGSLICAVLTGGDMEPQNENVVQIVRSLDDGETWSAPETVFKHKKRGCWCSEIFTGCERDFAFVHTYYAQSHYRELQNYISYCDESGENWTDPVSIKGSVNGCSMRQGIKLSNGDFLFPLYWQEAYGDFEYIDEKTYKPMDIVDQKWRFVVGVGISSDNNEHITRYGYLDAHTSLWEPNAIEVEDGHIVMYMRSTDNYLYFSESFDYGRTWSKAVLSDIKNPDSKTRLLKVGKTILLVYNDAPLHDRRRLSISKSTDGKNFEFVTFIDDPNVRYFYPEGFIDEEKKTVYIAYENGNDHFLARYSFDELGITL